MEKTRRRSISTATKEYTDDAWEPCKAMHIVSRAFSLSLSAIVDLGFLCLSQFMKMEIFFFVSLFFFFLYYYYFLILVLRKNRREEERKPREIPLLTES